MLLKWLIFCSQPFYSYCNISCTCLFSHLTYCLSFTHPHSATSQRCQPNQFECKNGQCVDVNKKCDQQIDCSDGSDEANCSK